ncbi:hypothetical protein CHU98_g1980, partial [Xylaria longipes]
MPTNHQITKLASLPSLIPPSHVLFPLYQSVSPQNILHPSRDLRLANLTSDFNNDVLASGERDDTDPFRRDIARQQAHAHGALLLRNAHAERILQFLQECRHREADAAAVARGAAEHANEGCHFLGA